MSWNTMAMSRFCGGSAVTSRSPKYTRPDVGASRPAIMRSVVVLPQPEGPTNVKNSRSPISTDTSSTAVTRRPKCLLTCSSRTATATLLRAHAETAEQVLLQEEHEGKGRDEIGRAHV